VVPTEDVPVLRDDRAPVDRLLDPMLGRRYVIEQAANDTTNATSAANGSAPVEAPGAIAHPAALARVAG
jgi:hypothetical protein